MWLPEGVTPDAKKLGGLHGVDERRHVVEEPQDFLGAGRGRVERRPGDADVTQLLQRAGVGFGALDGDGMSASRPAARAACWSSWIRAPSCSMGMPACGI